MEVYSAVVMELLTLAPLLMLGTGVYFARRFVGALERRAEAKAEIAELRARVAELEAAQEATQRDVLRLQAGHEFATQLLGAQVAAGALPRNDPAVRGVSQRRVPPGRSTAPVRGARAGDQRLRPRERAGAGPARAARRVSAPGAARSVLFAATWAVTSACGARHHSGEGRAERTETCPADRRDGVTPPDTTIAVGEHFTPAVEVWLCAGAKRAQDQWIWRAADTLVVLVDSLGGRVTGRRPGATVVSVAGRRYGGAGHIEVTVRPPLD